MNLRWRRWFEYLKVFDCRIEYTEGKANKVADALSRKCIGFLKHGEEESNELNSLTCLANKWLEWEKAQLKVVTIQPTWEDEI